MKYKQIVFLSVAILILASCGSSKKVVYFQDAQEGVGVALPPVRKIRIQPDDKISIIVKSRDYNLTNLFNLPYFTQRIGSSTENVAAQNYTQGIAGYLVDENGNIEFPVLGSLHVAGRTRTEIQDYIRDLLIHEDLMKDPVVVVDYMNLRVGVMGEVNAPGRYSIDHDEYTILDAITAAGDLTVYGKRENVKVLRTDGGMKYTYMVNVASLDSLAKSPAYYLQQNDMIYVEPNNVRARQSTVNGNNVLSAAFWISVATLISNIVLYFVK